MSLKRIQAQQAENLRLRQQLETAREALVAARYMIYYEDAPLGWNITRLDEALAAIGESQRAKCEHCDGSGDIHRADGEYLGECDCCKSAQPVSAEMKLIPNGWKLVPKVPTEKMIKASWNLASVSVIDGQQKLISVAWEAMLSAAPTHAQQPRQESEIAAEALTWQPIETAPKDGKRFLCATIIPNHRQVIAMSGVGGILLDEQCQPLPWPMTHWMPLPAAPKREAGK